MDLIKGSKSTSPCPDRGQFPQLEGSGPRYSAYKRGHANQSPLPEKSTKNRGSNPLRRGSGGMHHFRPYRPSSSTLVLPLVYVRHPTIRCVPLHPLSVLRLKIHNESIFEFTPARSRHLEVLESNIDIKSECSFRSNANKN
jgi:hypothetical protein